jgi:hypothetical protein
VPSQRRHLVGRVIPRLATHGEGSRRRAYASAMHLNVYVKLRAVIACVTQLATGRSLAVWRGSG